MRDIERIRRILREAFGDPIGTYAGNPPVGARSGEEDVVCPDCGMIPVDGECGCETCGEMSGRKRPKVFEVCKASMRSGEGSCTDESAEPCKECGMLEVEESCGCEK